MCSMYIIETPCGTGATKWASKRRERDVIWHRSVLLVSNSISVVSSLLAWANDADHKLFSCT